MSCLDARTSPIACVRAPVRPHSVPQVRYDAPEDARLAALMERVPLGSDTGRQAWQFKMALAVRCAGKSVWMAGNEP